MTYDTFRLLAPRAQLTFSLTCGTYLAHRWQNDNRLRLYYMPDGARGFFVEIGHDPNSGQAVVVHSFNNPELLAQYARGVQLPKV